jgi:hypothetical protein
MQLPSKPMLKDGELIHDPDGRVRYAKIMEICEPGSKAGIQGRGPRRQRQLSAAMVKKPAALYGLLSVKSDLNFFPNIFALSRRGKTPSCISAFMAWMSLLLGRTERSSPKARTVAPLAARGLDGESAPSTIIPP